jgi:hypothetical protein
VALLVALTAAGGAWAQADKEDQAPRRYGVRAELEHFPQKTPKDVLASVVKAFGEQRVDYVLAHLADPDFVDQRVRAYGGRFEEVVREAKAKIVDDPATFRKLQRYLREGEWDEGDMEASVGVKEGGDRIFFRKVENRWYMENKKRAEEKGK